MIEKLKDGIFRIKIPFDKIYTSSFVLVEKNDAVIYDFGSNCSDAEKYIIPELNALNVTVKYLALSHDHGDHSGGIDAMMAKYPDARVISMKGKWGEPSNDGDVLLNRFKVVHLKGHSDDGMAILDMRTNTLLSGDTLQVWGVDRYKTYFTAYTPYIEALEKVKALCVDEIIASHEYEPCGAIAEGEEQISVFLDECKRAADYREKQEK